MGTPRGCALVAGLVAVLVAAVAHRAELRVSGLGATRLATASSIAGGINVEPSMRPTRYGGANPDGWWCVPPNCAGTSDPIARIRNELDLARALGVADVRMELPWALVEPVRGGFDWSRLDAIVEAARSRGVVLQPVLVFSPSWAAPHLNDPPLPADFEAFAEAVAARWRGVFPVIELWNEPDGGGYWTGGAAAYVADVLVPGYRGVRAGDPSARVEMGAPDSDEGTAEAWLKEIYSDGGGDSFDVAAFHNYIGTAHDEAVAYRRILDGHGQSAKPIWLGEYGAQEDAVNDTSQVALMRSVLGSGAPLAMAQWYNLRDDDSLSCCPPQLRKSAHWGLVQHDGRTRKDGFAVMRGLLAGAGLQGSGGAPDRVEPGGSDSRADGILVLGVLALTAVAAGIVVGFRRRGP